MNDIINTLTGWGLFSSVLDFTPYMTRWEETTAFVHNTMDLEVVVKHIFVPHISPIIECRVLIVVCLTDLGPKYKETGLIYWCSKLVKQFKLP